MGWQRVLCQMAGGGTLPLERQGSVFGNHSTGKTKLSWFLTSHQTTTVVESRL